MHDNNKTVENNKMDEYDDYRLEEGLSTKIYSYVGYHYNPLDHYGPSWLVED
jgi:hypothetical protein